MRFCHRMQLKRTRKILNRQQHLITQRNQYHGGKYKFTPKQLEIALAALEYQDAHQGKEAGK